MAFWAVQITCDALFLLKVNALTKIGFVLFVYFLLRNFYNSKSLKIAIGSFCIVMLHPFLPLSILSAHSNDCTTSYVSITVDIYFCILTIFVFIILLFQKLA